LKKKIEMIKDERESLDSALIKIMRENITDEHWNELVDEAKLRLKCERQ
jgi:hypothetical protein